MHVRGVDLEVSESGTGLPLLWGHGLMGSLAQEDAADLLAWTEMSEVARLIRYDARGHGCSEATLDPDAYRWPDLARDLWALADALGVERAVLGGVSMGSATALHAAVSDPARTLGLVLMAPPTAWETRARQSGIYRGSAHMIDWVGLTPFRALGTLASLGVSNAALAGLQRSVMTGLRRADRRAVAAALRGAAASDLPEPDTLATLSMPTLILAWSGDSSHPLSTAERLAKLLPDARLHVARNAEDMRAWAPLARDFLRALG